MDVRVHDLRDFTPDRHRTVDDVPYGGGPGMVMKVEPFVRALRRDSRRSAARRRRWCCSRRRAGGSTRPRPGGLAGLGHVVLLCGRYEGIDERVRELVATEELSIGDYVVSGGETGGAAS